MTRLLAGVGGAVLLAVVLWDAFETIILPRRVSGRFRITRLFYRSTWRPWRSTAQLLSGRRRDAFLSFFGPLSLILLLALWAVGIVFAFGLLQWAAGSALIMSGGAPGIWSDVYMSGTTFFTLGLGDVAPRTALAKALTTAEAGMGFAFLAVVIGYFPVIYQAFSRREVAISLLDARAGSPPSASELLWRHRGDPGWTALVELLRDWERWSADVLESHLSYPALAYFRSQHRNESWLAALTTILDTSAFVIPAANIGRFGNSARNVIVGPTWKVIHGALAKSFSVSERTKVQVQFNVLNLFNTENFELSPSALNLSQPATAGKISALRIGIEAFGPRTINLELRVTF